MVDTATRVEVLLRRERLIIVGGMLVICLLAWYYLINGAGTGMSTLAMTTWTFPPPVPSHNAEYAWSGMYWLTMLMMWWIMMIAMMVPSAAPMILLFGKVHRHHQKQNQSIKTAVPTASFLGGYLLAWFAFSVAATILQWVLERLGLMHSMLMWSTSTAMSAWFLLAAGLYQLSPLKGVCLDHCRSPVGFLSKHWRAGQYGALRMGIDHGLYCVGCCWFLMVLLFVGGIMNLVWIAGLAVFVLLEKLAPAGHLIARVSGVIMIGSGLYLLMNA